MNDHETIAALAERIAAAIGRRDANALRLLLAPGFFHRDGAGVRSDADAFLSAVAQIPYEIKSVRLERLAVDVFDATAIATGIQHAQVMVEGKLVDDRRGFLDVLVKRGSGWLLQAAVEPPLAGE